MGNSTSKKMSKQQVKYAPNSVLMNHVNGFIKTLMETKTEKLFHDKNSCKNIHMILEDRILNAVSKNDLIGLRSNGLNLIIGYEYVDQQKLDSVCSHFKKYYLKKLELAVTIGTIEDIINTKLFFLKERQFCLTEDDKRTVSSDITITESSAWKRGQNRKPYNIPTVYAENILKRGSRTEILKSVPDIKGSENYFISELDNPEDCIRNNGFWATADILEDKGRIPVRGLTDFKGQQVNTKWFQIYDELINDLILIHKNLESFLLRLVKIENIAATDASGSGYKYTEIDITDLDMQKLTDELLKVMTVDIINIEKKYLSLIFTRIETRKSLQEYESTELKRRTLEESTNASIVQNQNNLFGQLPGQLQGQLPTPLTGQLNNPLLNTTQINTLAPIRSPNIFQNPINIQPGYLPPNPQMQYPTPFITNQPMSPYLPPQPQFGPMQPQIGYPQPRPF